MPDFEPKLAAMLASQEPRLEPLLRWLLEAAPERRADRLLQLHEALGTEGLLERLGAAWAHTSAIRLLAETGLPDRTNFLGEGFLRLVDKVIPRLDPEGDLYALLSRLDLDRTDAEWVASLPAAVCEIWAPVLSLPTERWVQAARLLAHRASALGLSRDLLALAQEGSDADSPFFHLSEHVRSLGERLEDPAAAAAWETCLEACHDCLRKAHARLDERGISTDLVFRMELLEAQLARMTHLMGFAQGRGDGRLFAAELVRGSAEQRSVRALLRKTFKRLARRMVEHAGETGEHYIARNRREWWEMARSAAGGGLLTAGTALLKYGLQALPLAPLLLGLGLASNYAASFCLMQVLGFSLASKQPAMTAAALAGALEQEQGTEAEVELVAAITRTQMIATLGNVLVAVPAALLLAGLWIGFSGLGPLGGVSALHSLQANHPFHGWTLLYAAGTGVLLWASSLASGWVANWSAYRRLPEALAGNHRLREWLGVGLAEASGRFVRKHLAGFAGYGVLGLLLGFTPLLATFAGIPLEVRHVTLQAASLALASASLWAQGTLPWSDVIWGLLGVTLIGAANFSVSFGLALWTAIRARDLDGRATFRLLWALLRAFNQAPLRFLGRPARS
jgi:site-specific recombinase